MRKIIIAGEAPVYQTFSTIIQKYCVNLQFETLQHTTMANERIFISYKRVNKEPVFAIIDRIERELGVKCWVDLDGIETSAQFASKICTAIDRAEVVLFMHSSAHLDINYDSDWTIRELDYAHSENKHVVLVKLDDAPLKNIFKLIYGTRNNIDSRNTDQWNILMRDLRRWLNLEAPQTQPAPPHPKPQPTPSKTPLQELEERLARLDKEVGDLKYFTDSNSKYGFKNKSGMLVIPCTWKDANGFCEGLAAVRDSNGKWGFIDKTGKVVIPCTWEGAGRFSEGLASVLDSNSKCGFIDKTGKVVIPCKWYNHDGSFHEGIARVQDSNGKWCYIDKTGKVIYIWQFISAFHEGIARVRDSNDKWGYIDKTYKVVIPCKWKEVEFFSEGLAAVQDTNGKWGYIDKTGNVVIPCKWYKAWDFKNGEADVFETEHIYYTINKTGKVLRTGFMYINYG